MEKVRGNSLLLGASESDVELGRVWLLLRRMVSFC